LARYRRWVFEANATKDDFLRHLVRALGRRDVQVGAAKVFDVSVQGHGARGWIKVLHHPQGIDVILKEKGALAGHGLADAVLEAGREAQSRILFGEPKAPSEAGS